MLLEWQKKTEKILKATGNFSEWMIFVALVFPKRSSSINVLQNMNIWSATTNIVRPIFLQVILYKRTKILKDENKTLRTLNVSSFLVLLHLLILIVQLFPQQPITMNCWYKGRYGNRSFLVLLKWLRTKLEQLKTYGNMERGNKLLGDILMIITMKILIMQML